ncbi:MAG: glycosyltransferase family 4 protein [Deltaproteobacteria bacterium]|nr:glycosyltransferase family 4 protein [Deltaproteobacteria bacterium]
MVRNCGCSPTVFLAVGNLKPEKGFEDLIVAAEELVRRGTPPSFTVLIAGGGSNPDYHALLRRQLHERNLGDRVKFLGLRRDMKALYSAADVFVLSSRKEGLPTVLLEAMSAGIPVVATRVGAVPTVIETGTHGTANPSQLAEAMQTVATSPESAAMAMRAKRHVLEHYGVRRMAENYLDAYHQTARRKELNPVTFVGNSEGPGVLHLGPQPPLTGGMATVVENLFNSTLADRFLLIGMNTGKTTREGRSTWEAICAQVSLVAQLISVIRKHKPVICHLHACEYFGYWRDCVHALMAGFFGCRLIWHIHSGRFHQWCCSLPPLLTRLLRFSMEKASAVIMLSEQFADNLKPFAPQANFCMVRNGIPMPRDVFPLAEEPTTVLFMGNWSPVKGVADLVQSTSMAVREMGFSGRVLLAGFEKDAGQRAKLYGLIAKSGCTSHIKVLGRISGLVLPSYGEGLPMAILEAMAHGRMVIATRVGAIPELIRNQVDGLLLDPGDIHTLARHLAFINRNRDRLREMGRFARERVEKEYEMTVMAHRVSAVYDSVLQNSDSKGKCQ